MTHINKIKNLFSNIKLSTQSAIILGAVIIAISHVGYGYVISLNNSNSNVTFFTGKLIDKGDYIYGDKKSEVIVIEYSDPECPYCVKFSDTAKKIHEEYKNNVSFVYRHFPLSFHKNAFVEAKAIECAGLLGGEKSFYEYIDALYNIKYLTQNPNTGSFTPLEARGKELLAEKIGLNKDKFYSCFSSDEFDEKIENSLEDGVAAGVEGTPATFVLLKNGNGYEVIAKIDGARQYSFVKAAIEQALSR